MDAEPSGGDGADRLQNFSFGSVPAALTAIVAPALALEPPSGARRNPCFSRPVVAASIDRETFPDRAGFGGAPLGPGLAEPIT